MAAAFPNARNYLWLIDMVTTDLLSALSDVPNNKYLDAIQVVPHVGLEEKHSTKHFG